MVLSASIAEKDPTGQPLDGQKGGRRIKGFMAGLG